MNEPFKVGLALRGQCTEDPVNLRNLKSAGTASLSPRLGIEVCESRPTNGTSETDGPKVLFVVRLKVVHDPRGFTAHVLALTFVEFIAEEPENCQKIVTPGATRFSALCELNQANNHRTPSIVAISVEATQKDRVQADC